MQVNNIPLTCISSKDIEQMISEFQHELRQRNNFNTDEKVITENRKRFLQKYSIKPLEK
jgi:hypothetical protein